MFRENPGPTRDASKFRDGEKTMRTFRRVVVYSASTFAVLVMLFSSSAKAQTPTYHPGQTIRISVTFEGPDAGKIAQATMNWSTPSLAANQPAFSQSMYSSESRQTAPNTFEVSFKIPETQATGEYALDQLRGSTSAPVSVVFFYGPADFPVRKAKVENSNALTKPTIKDVKELP
jgi:hypothetical protein